MNLAGFPAYKLLSLQSFTTTAPAAITHPFPILTPGKMTQFAQIHVPVPIKTGLYFISRKSAL